MDEQRHRIENALRALFATFDKTANPDMLRGYLMGLRRLTADDVEVAVTRAIAECKTFPRPAELIELAGALTSEHRAHMAWNDVIDAVVRMGPYRWVSFEDRICNGVIRNLGGWDTFVSLFRDARSEDFTRAKFIKTYRVFADSVSPDSEVCQPLRGLATENPPRIYRIASTIPLAKLTHAAPAHTIDLFRAPAIECIRQEHP